MQVEGKETFSPFLQPVEKEGRYLLPLHMLSDNLTYRCKGEAGQGKAKFVDH